MSAELGKLVGPSACLAPGSHVTTFKVTSWLDAAPGTGSLNSTIAGRTTKSAIAAKVRSLVLMSQLVISMLVCSCQSAYSLHGDQQAALAKTWRAPLQMRKR